MANEMKVFLMTKQGQAIQERQAEKKEIPYDPKAIYQDLFVSVRPECLVVNKYFIPSMLPLEFPWDKIETLTYYPQNHHETPEKAPGKGLDSDGRWWATDVLRSKDRELQDLHNVRIDVHDVEPPKSGFTVIHIDQFLKACRHLLPYSCKLYGTIM